MEFPSSAGGSNALGAEPQRRAEEAHGEGAGGGHDTMTRVRRIAGRLPPLPRCAECRHLSADKLSRI